MHSWVGLVCHPKQSKGCVDRQLQPPPPSDDLPSPQKDQALDHGLAGPNEARPYPAMSYVAEQLQLSRVLILTIQRLNGEQLPAPTHLEARPARRRETE